jgi:hypothetical protein
MKILKNSILFGLAGLVFSGLILWGSSLVAALLTYNSIIVVMTICTLLGIVAGFKIKPTNAKTVKPHISAIPVSTQPAGPMMFKGSSVHTLITPIGSYAGKPSTQPMRALAEKRFNETNSSRGATIN